MYRANRKRAPFWIAIILVPVLLATVGLWFARIEPIDAPLREQSGSDYDSGRQPQSVTRSPTILEISGELPGTTREIQNMLQAGRYELNATGVNAALTYLQVPEHASSSSDPAAEYFNNVIAILLAQPKEVIGLSESLVAASDNETLPLLLRDYAMQHYFQAWIREKRPTVKIMIESRLRAHFGDTKSPLQGVALLTASRLLEQDAEIKGPEGETLRRIGGSTSDGLKRSKPSQYTGREFVETALRVAEDTSATPGARTCAFNALLRLEASESIHQARKVLSHPETPESVKCAAIATLGTFGDLWTDRVVLESVPQNPALVKAAAVYALSKIQRSQPAQ